MSYHISKTVQTDLDTTLTRVKEVLKKEDFGVLTEIDIKGSFYNCTGFHSGKGRHEI